MPQSVALPFPVNGVVTAEEKPSRTYRLDLDKGRIYGHINGTEAVQQSIRKALITPRFKCLIYNHQYGSELEQAIIIDDGTQSYIRAAAEGLVKDALKPDTRITAINDFKIQIVDDELFISFIANTIFGEIEIEEVV